MIIKKIAETVKISKANKELRKQRDWAIESISEYEKDGFMNLRRMMLNGAVLVDNEIADNCRRVRMIWGIDF